MVNNAFNYYFVIEFEGKKVGLINAKDYKPEMGFGEGGIFIGDQAYEHSFAAVYASLCLLNFVYYMLGTIEKSRIRILKSNTRAIQYNKLLGYEWICDSEDGQNAMYELTFDRFQKLGIKLNMAAKLFSVGSPLMELSGEASDCNLPEINALLLKKTPPMAIPGL